jgi:hypothetical protein
MRVYIDEGHASFGHIQIAIQYRRYRFLGISQVLADGFVVTVAGSVEPLSQQTIWDLT